MFIQKHVNKRLADLEAENKQLKRALDTIKHENAELTDMNNKLNLSRASTNSKLQRKLNGAIQQLSETRKQLLDVQDRLTVAEEVTAATRRRQLVQEGVDENLPTTSVSGDYEELRFVATSENVYDKLQPRTHTGIIVVRNGLLH